MVDAADLVSDDDPGGNPVPRAPQPLAEGKTPEPGMIAGGMTLEQAEAMANEFRAKLGLPPILSQVVGEASATASAESQQKLVNGMKRRRIMLEPNEDIPPTGLFLGHNGSSYLLKTGVWVDVPLPIIEILDNAVKQIPDVDPATRRVVGWRPSLRFSYRFAPGQEPSQRAA